MKKLLKIFLLLPLLLIAMSSFFACGEEYVTSVSASIPSSENVVVDRGRFYLEYSNTPIQLDVSITPSKFSTRNLTWSTTASNIAYVNNDGKFVMQGGAGDVNVQATYMNENGTIVSSVLLKFNISTTPLPNFANETASGTYSGTDLKNNYVVQNAKADTYEYVYYYIGDDNNSEEVDAIVDAGEYLITYVRSASQTKFTEMRLTVDKYTIVKTAPNCTSVYAEGLPEGFFSSNPTQGQFLNGNDLYEGVGEDAGKVIGKYLYKTNATTTSNVGNFITSVVYTLGEEYENNYILTSVSGRHTITAKQIVLAVNNQDIIYGNSPNSSYYTLYDYEEFTLNGNSIAGLTALTNEIFTRRINTGDYVLLQNDVVISKNAWGYIDAGIFDLNYDQGLISTDGNVSVEELLSGFLIVAKREVEITPDTFNSKIYTEEDNYAQLEYTYSGVISNINELVPFLTINYQGADYGTMNFKAPVGSYVYGINNNLNKNFTFNLTGRALSSYDGQDQILFEVKQCPVVIKFDNIVEYFETPNGYDENNNVVPTVSYYSVMTNNSIPNYELDSILSLKINGGENKIVNGVCLCAMENFENNGSFAFSTGETFKISLKLVAQTTVGNHYATYYVALQNNTSTETLNYSVTVEKSYVYLDKINITVIPSETENISSTIYSQNNFISNEFYLDYTILGEMENNVEVSTVLGTDFILSLTDSSGMFQKRNINGTYTAVESLMNCGDYKIFLSSNLSYSTGRNYYSFSLDTSKEYFYTIIQKPITITPDDSQGKIYGNADTFLTFIYGDSISNLPVSGSLVRASGENVGNYEISLGSLSFGSNYTLTLSDTTKYFAISKRDITVTPISYTTTFGDDYPVTIGYNDPLANEVYDSTILVRPTFSGEFQLYYGETSYSKVGGYYPVKIVGGTVVPYTIKQGTLQCSNVNNYSMTVAETSTYLVNKREATINVTPENKSSIDGISPIFTGFLNYTLTSEEGSEDVILSGISFTATLGDDRYYIDSLSDITLLTITKDSVDITECYNLSLGQSIVYYIASTIINLSIVGVDDETSSLVRVTYSGDAVTDKFKLICTTAGFEIDEAQSNYLISYSTNTSQNVTPLNAGSYYVSLNVGIASQVFIRRISNNESIEFSSLGAKVSNCVLNLSQFAYLNIAQADINYEAEYLSFESPITYGSDETALSNIKTTYEDGGVTKNIFTGVKDEVLQLKTYDDSKNFVFTSAPQLIRTLGASSSVTYSIKLTIQAIKSGTSDVDANYKTLTIDVQLTVVPSEIILDGSTALTYKGTYSTEGTIVYSGHASVFSLDVVTSTEGASFSNSYTYEGVKTFYNNSVAGYVEVYNYLDGVVSSTANTKLASDLSISTIQLVTYSGDRYYLINEEYCLLIETVDATPKNAGIYLCIATCTAGENFIFSGSLKSVLYYSFFEIERSNNIAINNWTSEFRWGTTFNIEDPSSLPFSYSMVPDFKSKVTYSVENQGDWESIGYVLAVNSSYEITITIDEENYYLSSPQTFAVISREAEIVFSTRTKYGYKGENQPIDLFLDDIVAILKDQNGVPIEEKKYIIDSTNFNLSFKTAVGAVYEGIPWEDGDYVLTVTYGTSTSNYYGEGTFAYTIEKAAFSGEISIINKEIEYNPSVTADVLYNIIVGSMFSIEEGWVYILTVKNEAGLVISTSNDNGWLSTINSVSVKKIKFTVTFNGVNTFSDYEGSAYLTITAKKIRTINFEIPTNDAQYSYSGNIVYNELKYNGTVNLAPKTVNSSVEYVVGSSTYYVRTLSYNSIKVIDSLNNDIFTLTYNYSYQSAVGSASYTSIAFAPITSKIVNYKVEYVFSNFGNNYSNKLDSSTITKYFKINKVSTLYISIFDDADDNYDTSLVREYSGDDFYDVFTTGNLNNIVSISNSRDIKNNIKKTIFKTSQNITYSSSGGVHIIVFFTDENGVVVTDLTNAGSYFLNISFLRNSNYSVSEFFEYVVFNASTTYATSTAFNSSSAFYSDANYQDFAYIYETYFSIPLTIEQEECEYNSSTLSDLIVISAGGYITEQSGLDTILVFEANTKFTLPASTPYSLVFENYYSSSYFEIVDTTTFYNQGEFFFTNFVEGEEYSILIVDVNGNYKNSEHIIFRVLAP